MESDGKSRSSGPSNRSGAPFVQGIEVRHLLRDRQCGFAFPTVALNPNWLTIQIALIGIAEKIFIASDVSHHDRMTTSCFDSALSQIGQGLRFHCV